ncbi:MAG: phosphonate metabolism protein/1,5-bisphosphokinase (PRPP-forming) PhnN [Acidovorax sp.]|nr:MAG: phosphonate metabolism protein/1,5-bisphosphokinase (PRPP-forming) PhnN [Acidovorax sp.]
MTQRLVYFMGPSGAGKDSLLDWLRAQLPGHLPLRWARRTISRPMDPGGEAHESVTPPEFTALREAAAFALHWEANGLCYGIRHEELSPQMAGGWVLLNGSRAYLPQALERFPQMNAVHITASPEVLRRRLLARGRESADQVEARVQRALAFQVPAGVAGIAVHNNGALDDAGRELLKALSQLPGWPDGNGTLAPPRPLPPLAADSIHSLQPRAAAQPTLP